MIKNEFIKFFTPLKLIVYTGFLLTCILLPLVIFNDNSIVDPYDFVITSMNDVLVLIIPIILTAVVSEIFTYDYESGCMKFFIIYKKRKNVFFSKVIALISIAFIFIAIAFASLLIIYAIQNPEMIYVLSAEILDILRIMLLFLISIIPIILIYTMISIISKNSLLISLLTFLLIMMSDLFTKYIIDVTPTRFFRTFLTKNNNIDNFSIILFISYIVIFLLLDLILFSKKEMLQ